MNWVYQGRCWKFGDNISCDAELMKKEFASQRETRPEILRDHVLVMLDPEFPKKVAPGDLLVAGKRFAQGNPHIQGLIGIAALGLGLVVESIPRGSLRNAINAGLPLLPNCAGVTAQCETGDELRVDFASGLFENITRGTKLHYAPFPPPLLDIIAAGGWEPTFKRRLEKMGLIAA